MMRATTKMDDDLKEGIQALADKNRWPFDYMCYVLLQQAVKEKTRKRRGKTEDNPESDPADLGQSNG